MQTLAKNALKQIEDKNYAQAFEATHKVIHLIGVGFLEKNEDKDGKVLLEIDAKWKLHKVKGIE